MFSTAFIFPLVLLYQIHCHPIDVGNAKDIIPPIGNESIVVNSMPTSTPQQIQLMEGKDDELVFVHSIWRHGDRTPIYTYPNDPNQIDAWPQGFAELTTRGMAQHVQLGKFLRRRYIEQLKFLSTQYKNNEIYVISTDTNRTIQSATANLIGMFGPGARWGIDYPDLSEWPATFIPIPVHTYEFKKDPVGYARTYCQRTIELFDLRMQTPEFQQLNQSSAALLEQISEYAGAQITLDSLWGFIETVNIEKTHGLNPPEWALQILPQTIEINTRLIDFQNGLGMAPFLGIDFAMEMPKLLGGTFLWELIERMGKKAECLDRGINLTPKSGSDPFTPLNKKTLRPNDVRSECGWLGALKYYAHSAHDMTLAALFATFQFDHVDFDRNGFPTYASCLLLELWRNPSGQYYVKVLYRRENDQQELIDLTPHIRGCENGCTLEQFKQRSLPFKQEPDQETLCNTPLIYRPEANNNKNTAGWWGSSNSAATIGPKRWTSAWTFAFFTIAATICCYWPFWIVDHPKSLFTIF